MRRARLALPVLVLAVLAGCGEEGAPTPSGEPRPAVFEPGQLTWAQRSTIHVGDRTFDLGPDLVESIDWTPYGVYLRLTRDPVDGPSHEVFYDGTTMTAVPDVSGEIITSPDGRLAAWIDRHGPQRPAGRVRQVVVVDTETGDRVYQSADGMGGEKGDDLGDRYEELMPYVIALTGDELVWRNASGSGDVVTVDLASGDATTSDHVPRLRPTTGYEAWSPDGRYRVDASTTGKVRVSPRPDYGHRFQRLGGWLGDHTMVVLAQDRFAWSYDPTKPDKIPGYLLACDLDASTCRQLAQVRGAREVVFAGNDTLY